MTNRIKISLIAILVSVLPSLAQAEVGTETCSVALEIRPTIELVLPNGGQVLKPEAFYDIVWSATDVRSVGITMSIDGGLTYPIVLTDSASGNLFRWTVNNYDSDTVRIRVEVRNGCGELVTSAASAANLSIDGTYIPRPEVVESAVSFSTPASGEEITGTVLVQAETAIPVAKLELTVKNSASGKEEEISAVGDDDGKSWTGFWDTLQFDNGPHVITAKAWDEYGRPVGESKVTSLTVRNIILPSVTVGLLNPAAGAVLDDYVQISAVTDQAVDALDFVVRPKQATTASDPAVIYGLTDSRSLLWTTSFDTRKYSDGSYLIKAKAYLSGTVVGESREVEVSFDNPETGPIVVTISSPAGGFTAEGVVALVARTPVAGEAVDFVITADDSAGGEARPTVVKAIPDLEKKKWTAIWESYDVPNGRYGLKAKTYRNGILAGESPLQSMSVKNSVVLVALGISTPANGATVTGTVPVRVTVGEAVDRIELTMRSDDAPEAALPIGIEVRPNAGKLEWTGSWNTLRELDGRYYLMARAWYQGHNVAETPVTTVYVRNETAGTEATSDLSLAEAAAPKDDPNVDGAYDRVGTISSTPTVNFDLDLQEVPETSYLLSPGTLFKSPDSATVYYYGRDGRRYGFPDSRTYFTWYRNFNNVRTVGAEVVAAIRLGGNITYRPGIRMVKIQSDPKVYAIARGGVLRWIKNEVVARRIYGTDWNKMIDDVSDAFFFSYRIGDPIEN